MKTKEDIATLHQNLKKQKTKTTTTTTKNKRVHDILSPIFLGLQSKMATVGNTERALAGIALLTFPKSVLDTPQRKVTSAVHIKSCCWTTVIS